MEELKEVVKELSFRERTILKIFKKTFIKFYNYTRIEIKKWIKQDDVCKLIGIDNAPVLYMYGIEKDVLFTSMNKEASPDNISTQSLRAK